MVREATLMSDDLEKLLESVKPRGAPAELRGRVLRIVEEELRPIDGLPASIESVLSPSASGQTPGTKQKRKWTKMQRRILIAAAVLVALIPAYLFGNTVWILVAAHGLGNKIAALKAAGDPVALSDLARADLPDDKNAAVQLQQAKKELAELIGDLNRFTEQSEDYKTGTVNAEDRKKLAALFAGKPAVLQAMEAAGECTAYHTKLDFTAKPEVVTAAAFKDGTDFRGVVALLQARIRLQVAQGEQHDAMQTCLLLLRLTRSYDGSLFLGNQLVVCAARSVAVEAANRVLRSGPVDAKDREALEAELILHDSHAGYVKSLKKERALGMALYSDVKNFLNRAIMDVDESSYLDLMQEQIDLAPMPYSEFTKAVDTFKAGSKPFAPLASSMFPATQKVREAAERTRGIVRCLRILNALQQAGIKPENGEPNLADLQLPEQATKDPFTGEALHVKVVDSEWLVYTVGPDLKDDGGDLANYKDFGVGPLSIFKK
jgi:hypothetical protein